MMINTASRFAGLIGVTAMLLGLSGCSTFGNPLEALGAKIPPPDEFEVIARKPLVLPASTNSLPEPRPGAASPLDPNPNRDALQALLGTNTGSAVASVPPSAGEQVLLSSANAAATSSGIRVQLEEEKIASDAKKPYEAPSIGELLGGRKAEKLDEKQLLDPIAESQRLQRDGQVAPVDPNASAEVNREDLPPAPAPNYPSGRPESPFKTN